MNTESLPMVDSNITYNGSRLKKLLKKYPLGTFQRHTNLHTLAAFLRKIPIRYMPAASPRKLPTRQALESPLNGSYQSGT